MTERTTRAEDQAQGRGDQDSHAPSGRQRGGSWWAAVKRTVREFQVDNLSDWAAALTYYSVLSIFPALLVVISLVDLAGSGTIQTLLDNLGQVVPGSVNQILATAIENLQQTRGSAELLALVSLATALWLASRYIAAFMRASNAIYDVPEAGRCGRPCPSGRGHRGGHGPAGGVGGRGGGHRRPGRAPRPTAGDRPHSGQGLGPGQVAGAAADRGVLFALLYWASPNARQPFRWITPGGILAVVVWVVASAAFALYVANFNSYNKTYGSLASVIIFLVWLWLSNTAILLGAELNAELERGRAIAAGHPPDQEPYGGCATPESSGNTTTCSPRHPLAPRAP